MGSNSRWASNASCGVLRRPGWLPPPAPRTAAALPDPLNSHLRLAPEAPVGGWSGGGGSSRAALEGPQWRVFSGSNRFQ
eukprot:131955-Alexandrium_andersonii.AAC.1